MSLTTKDGMTAVFPLEWIKNCISTYTKEHGQEPKILVLSTEDYLDYSLNGSLAQVNQLNVKVVNGIYLKKGEIDLAMAIKN